LALAITITLLMISLVGALSAPTLTFNEYGYPGGDDFKVIVTKTTPSEIVVKVEGTYQAGTARLVKDDLEVGNTVWITKDGKAVFKGDFNGWYKVKAFLFVSTGKSVSVFSQMFRIDGKSETPCGLSSKLIHGEKATSYTGKTYIDGKSNPVWEVTCEGKNLYILDANKEVTKVLGKNKATVTTTDMTGVTIGVHGGYTFVLKTAWVCATNETLSVGSVYTGNCIITCEAGYEGTGDVEGITDPNTNLQIKHREKNYWRRLYNAYKKKITGKKDARWRKSVFGSYADATGLDVDTIAAVSPDGWTWDSARARKIWNSLTDKQKEYLLKTMWGGNTPAPSDCPGLKGTDIAHHTDPDDIPDYRNSKKWEYIGNQARRRIYRNRETGEIKYIPMSLYDYNNMMSIFLPEDMETMSIVGMSLSGVRGGFGVFFAFLYSIRIYLYILTGVFAGITVAIWLKLS